MSENLNKVKSYLLEMDVKITKENETEELVVIQDEDRGIQNMIIDCEEPIVIIEQPIIPIPKENKAELYKRLLQMNHEMVHGAFVINEEETTVFYRDTLQLENLDKNELEASISSLSLALAENANELIEFAKK
ncbi:MAG: YbjN domain-containing protein [Deferribacteres bacterium]|nr:YbjN domain-containing protein [candidate division KSB1 bacterium]MCB9501826.1 YbjN domain-containing protein [Deferribacteres bacterium]